MTRARRDISVKDHDPVFEAHRWMANLRILEIDEIKTVPHVPLSHPIVERLIGTPRREFLDQVPTRAVLKGESHPRAHTTPVRREWKSELGRPCRD
jgi:hypothetical protein